ncbi:Snf7-domain-containing protein [Schizophyllum commune]
MDSINRFIWGPTPEQRVREWQAKLRAESRKLDREMHQLDVRAKDAKKTVKQLATKGDVKSARILAREVVRVDRQKDRMSVSKARLGSINYQLQQQLAMAKVTGALQKSTEIMKLSNSLIRLPQISQTMREMSMEMMKAGILEEMTQDMLDMDADDEELEEEADAEVDQVLFALTDGKLGQAGSVSTEVPVSEQVADPAEDERILERYRQELASVLS